MQDLYEKETSDSLDPVIKEALLTAFRVEPTGNLISRIIIATKEAQVKRRNHLALTAMILSLIGISSPLLLLLLTPGRIFGYAIWRLYMGLQTMMLQSSLSGSYNPPIQAIIVTVVLLTIAGLLGMSATRLARTSR